MRILSKTPSAKTTIELEAIALAPSAGAELALVALKDESVHLVATLVALVVTRLEEPSAVLTCIVLHDVVPLLLHKLCLYGRRLLGESLVLGSRLCFCLPGELRLVKQWAEAFPWLSRLFPGRPTNVAEVSATSAGCHETVRFCWVKE